VSPRGNEKSLVNRPEPMEQSLRDQDWNSFLHELRSRELRRLPRGAETVLSGGAAGAWYFDWFRSCYEKPIHRHIAVEAFSPEPEHLPAEVEWLARTLGDLTPVADSSVDLVYAGQTIEHLWPEDVAGFLLEAHRVLKPDGRIVLDSPNRRISTAITWLQPEHTVEFTVSEIKELLACAGFSDIEIRGVWLCYDSGQHRFLPLDSSDPDDDWPDNRRVEEAVERAEDSFIWWAEAQRGANAPDPPRVTELTQRSYDAYRAFRVRQLEVGVGRVEREGDDVLVRTTSGEAGFLVAGPHIPMRAGNWSALFRVGTEKGRTGGPAEPVVRIDVAVEPEGRVVAERFLTQDDLPPDGRLREVDLPFSLTRTEFGVQLRVQSLGRVPVKARLRTEVEGGSRTAGVVESAAAAETKPPDSESAGATVAIARPLLWPLKRFFDPRFGGIATQISVTHDHVVDELGAANARLDETNSKVARIDHEVAELRSTIENALEQVRDIRRDPGRAPGSRPEGGSS
jgi:SAM-dependent methyltransferase